MRGAIAKGAAWMVLFRLLDRSIGLLSTAILARLLFPADFGLVAMAMSIIGVVELATSFSFELALIQKAEPQREHYDTAWTLNVIVGIAGGAAIAALGWPTAAFYGDARIVPVMAAIGAAWVIAGFENIGTVDFRRRMDFSAEFRLMAIRRLIGFVVTMAAALLLRSYWALVIGTIATRSSGVVLSYLLHPFRPRPSLRARNELFSFSGWMVASNFAGVVIAKVPHFIVGRWFGAQSLGAYTVGSEIAHLAYTELVAPINRATFPGYARLVNDPPAFRRTCLDATAAILLIVLPVSTAVALLAEPIVRVLLGPQWQAAAPVIQALVFSGAVSAATSNNVAAYLAMGRPWLATVILLVRLAMLGLFVALLSARHGMLSVAYADLFSSIASLAVSLPILFVTLDLRWTEYLRQLWRPVVGSALMGAVMWAALSPLPDAAGLTGSVLQLVVAVPVGLVGYPIFVAALWRLSGRPASVEVLLARRLGDTLRQRFSKGSPDLAKRSPS